MIMAPERWESTGLITPRRGGNGEVTQVRDLTGQWPGLAAKKTLLDGRSYERFRREGQGYSHPTILPVIDAWIPDTPDEPGAYIVMPWCTQSLVENVRAGGLVGDVVGAVSAMLPIVEAAEYLHARGVAHRDIKPSNILLLDGSAILGDFGLARGDEDTDLTGSHENLGSVRYRPPEYLDHMNVTDFRPGDVFALAKTIWALVAGREPEAGDVLRYPHHNLTRRFTTKSEALIDLQALLGRMTLSNPEQRPSMSEARRELEAISRPRERRPASAAPPMERLVKRLDSSAEVQERKRDAEEAARLGGVVEALLKRVASVLTPRMTIVQNAAKAAGEITTSGLRVLLPIDPSARVLIEGVPELSQLTVPLGFYGVFGCFVPDKDLPELRRVYVSFGCCLVNNHTAFVSATGSEEPEHASVLRTSTWRRIREAVFVRDVDSVTLSRNLEQIVERQVADFESLVAGQVESVPQ